MVATSDLGSDASGRGGSSPFSRTRERFFESRSLFCSLLTVKKQKKEEFYITTYGWGHDVGMSQNGAQTMAQMGYDYEDILKHYYTGITIED